MTLKLRNCRGMPIRIAARRFPKVWIPVTSRASPHTAMAAPTAVTLSNRISGPSETNEVETPTPTGSAVACGYLVGAADRVDGSIPAGDDPEILLTDLEGQVPPGALAELLERSARQRLTFTQCGQEVPAVVRDTWPGTSSTDLR